MTDEMFQIQFQITHPELDDPVRRDVGIPVDDTGSPQTSWETAIWESGEYLGQTLDDVQQEVMDND